MKNKQILFFATLLDINPIIKLLENEYSVKYYEMGLFNDRLRKEIHSIFEMPNLIWKNVSLQVKMVNKRTARLVSLGTDPTTVNSVLSVSLNCENAVTIMTI